MSNYFILISLIASVITTVSTVESSTNSTFNSTKSDESQINQLINPDTFFFRASQCIINQFVPNEDRDISIKRSVDNSYEVEEHGIMYTYIPRRENFTTLMVYQSQPNPFSIKTITLKTNTNECTMGRIQYKNESEKHPMILEDENLPLEFTFADRCQNESLFCKNISETCDIEKRKMETNLTGYLTAKYNLKEGLFINYILSFWKGKQLDRIADYDGYNKARLGLFPLANAESLNPQYGEVVNDVLSFQYPVNMPQCTSFSQPSLHIVVISAPESFKKRDTIRKGIKIAIASQKDLLDRISFGFFIELTDNSSTQTKIEEESNVYADIVQMNIASKSYRDSTFKMAAVLNWINSYCPSVNVIFKVEEDVKFEVSKVFGRVRVNRWQDLVLGIRPDDGNRVRREGGSRTISYEEFPWNQYPAYYNGSAYFLSGRSILPLLACFQTTPIFPFEDVYVTGICRQKIGMVPNDCGGNVANNFCF